MRLLPLAILVLAIVGWATIATMAAEPTGNTLPPAVPSDATGGQTYDDAYDSYYEPRPDNPTLSDQQEWLSRDRSRYETEGYYELRPPLTPYGQNSPYRVYPQYYPRDRAMLRQYAE